MGPDTATVQSQNAPVLIQWYHKLICKSRQMGHFTSSINCCFGNKMLIHCCIVTKKQNLFYWLFAQRPSSFFKLASWYLTDNSCGSCRLKLVHVQTPSFFAWKYQPNTFYRYFLVDSIHHFILHLQSISRL